jgi:Protein of unknown function (DUF2793)
MDTSKLILPLIAANQAQKHVPVNEALRKLDAIVRLSVKDRDLTAPPGSPQDGDCYIPASGATGAWATWDLNIALYTDGAWVKLVPREGWLCWVDDENVLIIYDGAAWGFGEMPIGNLRVGRDMLQNVLPDSGRFNGNANNTVFSGIAYTAPTYLSPASGAAFASHAKFVHDNSDYGGGGATLDPEVKALIDKIRPAAARRYGPEWYVIKMTQTAGALTESQLVGGVAHGLIGINANVALPNKFTVGYYVKVKTGSAAIRVNSPRVARAAIDGAAVPAGVGTSPVPLVNADGWKHVNLESTPNQYNYDNTAFQLLASAGSELYLAMPKITFGHANLDPNLGVLMNARMFG